MKLHNTMEDEVIFRVDEILDVLDKEENHGKFCTCNQCRMDVICYTLNRLQPHYIVSHRGASRLRKDGIERQQQTADIAALIYEGIKRVTHNQRPNCAQHTTESEKGTDSKYAVFNIPTIMGRLFNGDNFSPLADVDVELLLEGEIVPMKDANWHNPCRLVHNTEGSFSFWPAPVKASRANTRKIFTYTLRVSGPEFETLTHFFKIPVASETQAASSFSLERTFKLPDLYMFPPGEAEKNGYLG